MTLPGWRPTPSRGKALRREIEQLLDERDGGASIRIARYAPRADWVGLDLATIAAKERKSPVELVIDIERHGGASAISFGMNEDDVREVMRHDFVATASDGSTHVPGGGDRPHPRAYGTFPRKVRYALDDKVLTLEQAIRSCSGWPAEILGLPDRGVIRAACVCRHRCVRPHALSRLCHVRSADRLCSGREVSVRQWGRAHRTIGPSAAAGTRGKLPGRALRLKQDGPADDDLQGQADLDRGPRSIRGPRHWPCAAA